MSPTCKPVLIGSYAALLGGFLPAWREGVARDIDICCTPDQAPLFADGKVVTVAPGKLRLPRSGRRSVDIDTTCAADGRLELMNSLCATGAMIEGVAVLLASAEIIWASRAYTVGLNPHQHAKAVRDMLWYDALPLRLTPEHLDLTELFRRDGLAAAAHHLI